MRLNRLFFICVLAGWQAVSQLPEATGANYNWTGDDASWNDAGKWSPGGGPPGAGDIGTVNNGKICRANANLAAGTEIDIYTNCYLDLYANTSGHTIVLTNGTLRTQSSGYLTRTSSDTIKIQGTGYVQSQGNEGSFNLNGLIADGAFAGRLVASWRADGLWQEPTKLNGTNNTYSGGTEVLTGRTTWPSATCGWADRLYANAPGCLGTGDVTVRSNGWLALCTTNATGPGAVINVDAGGLVEIIGTVTGHTITVTGGYLRHGYVAGTQTSVDNIRLQGTCYVQGFTSQEGLNVCGLIADGTSAGRLVACWNSNSDSGWQDSISLSGTNNTYSGGTEVRASRMNWPEVGNVARADRLFANAPGCLGTGDVTVKSNGWLVLCTTNTTGPGAIITVEAGGVVEILGTTTGHTIILADGQLRRKNSGLVPYSLNSGTSADNIKLQGTCYVIQELNEASLTLSGLIQDGVTPGKLVIMWAPYNNWGAPICLGNTNTSSGGLEVRPTQNRSTGQWQDSWADWLYAQATNCLGNGPITLYPDSWVNLSLGSAADWILTNSFAMGSRAGVYTQAMIKVQAGAHRLTVAGNTVTPGAFTSAATLTTNTTGVLCIDGKFAFAQTNGNYATFRTGLAETNGVAGIDYSQLNVKAGDATLADSITNCDLVVVVPNTLGNVSTQTFTIVSAAGASFSGATPFRRVTWSPGWSGNVQYGNGVIQLVNVGMLGAVFSFR